MAEELQVEPIVGQAGCSNGRNTNGGSESINLVPNATSVKWCGVAPSVQRLTAVHLSCQFDTTK